MLCNNERAANSVLIHKGKYLGNIGSESDTKMIMADFLILFSLQNSASDKLGRGCKVLRQGGGAIGLPVRGLELGGGSRAPILPHFPNYTFPTQAEPAPGKLLQQQTDKAVLVWLGHDHDGGGVVRHGGDGGGDVVEDDDGGGNVGHDDDGDGNVVHGGDGDGDVVHGGDARVLIEGWSEHED